MSVVSQEYVPLQSSEQELSIVGDARWIAVRELSVSASFARSPRLSQLLLYLASRTLASGYEAISEQEIARHVFGRDESFHPSSDTIVRSHLLRLRQRLEQHELQPASSKDRYRITIPKGQYRVEFQERTVISREDTRHDGEARTSLTASPENGRTTQWGMSSLGWALVTAICMGAVMLATLYPHRSIAPASTNPLWDALFFSGQKTIFVAADSSLVILHQYLRHDTSLADYLSGSYRENAHAALGDQPEILSVANRRYTSMVDLSMVQHITKIAVERHSEIDSRFARELSVEDLKANNAVISGSRGANPWVELFEPQMNFTVTNDYTNGGVVVRNRRPLAGERNQYVEGSGESGKPLYGVLAFLPNLDPSHNVLIMEGTSLAATQAICDLVSNEKSFLPVLSKVRRNDGSLKHFELLISSTVVNGYASKFEILSYRTYD